MTFVYHSPEPTKQCTICKGIFEHRHLVVGTSYADGVRPLCKPCRQVQQAEERIRRKQRTAEITKAELEARKEIPNLVPPRTFTHLKDEKAVWTGHTERQYVRNEGLKHIPSRGMPT